MKPTGTNWKDAGSKCYQAQALEKDRFSVWLSKEAREVVEIGVNERKPMKTYENLGFPLENDLQRPGI